MKTFKEFCEAAGDPIKSSQIIPLDAEAQRNLRNAATSSGPPPMRPVKRDKVADKVRTYMNNTILSPM